MLEVQKFLKGASLVQAPERALASLNEQFGIKNNVWEGKLVVLNYCQINSPKKAAITSECRSLVLEVGTWEVVSRSFDRFFNYGEEPCPALNPTFLTAYEKVDGSLIGVFNYKGEWMYRTRSVIMPTGQINGWDNVTWDSHIEDALGNTYKYILSEFDDMTFILELTSMENRVVTKYNGEPAMTLLAVRSKEGNYMTAENRDIFIHDALPEWRAPATYQFSTMSECVYAAKELRGLEEGFVMYTRHEVPVSKIKNPAYVAAHHLRGDGLNSKRIKDLIIMNEVDEYLAIFPEDKVVFFPYQDAFNWLMQSVREWWKILEPKDFSSKDFAAMIVDLPFKALLFSLRKGISLDDAWANCTTNYKYILMDAMTRRNINPKEVIDHAGN